MFYKHFFPASFREGDQISRLYKRAVKIIFFYVIFESSRDISLELKMINLTERIERQKENWHEYILRMPRDPQIYY
jgi:hypothetical protein